MIIIVIFYLPTCVEKLNKKYNIMINELTNNFYYSNWKIISYFFSIKTYNNFEYKKNLN